MTVKLESLRYLVCCVLDVPSDSPVVQWKACVLNPPSLSLSVYRSSLAVFPLFSLSQNTQPIPPSVSQLFHFLQERNGVYLSHLYWLMMWSSWWVGVTERIAPHKLQEYKHRSWLIVFKRRSDQNKVILNLSEGFNNTDCYVLFSCYAILFSLLCFYYSVNKTFCFPGIM